jgi:hypothetical protein
VPRSRKCGAIHPSPISLHGVVEHRNNFTFYLCEIRSVRKCRPKFREEKVPSTRTIHNLVNELRTTGLLIDNKQKYKRRVLTEEKLMTRTRLEDTPRKLLKILAHETGVSKSSARTTTQLLKLRPYKATVIHILQPCHSASRVQFCSWFLQYVVEGEIDQQLTFFSDEAWFHLQGYINTQNNCYWSSQNRHLTHEVPLCRGKVGVWCAVKCKKNRTTHADKRLFTQNCLRNNPNYNNVVKYPIQQANTFYNG